MKPYYKQVLVRDYLNVKIALEHAVDLCNQCDKDNYGCVILYFDKFSDIKQMPTHEVLFTGNRQPVESAQEEFDTVITHNVAWTESLLGNGLPRLMFYYDDSSNEDKITEFYESQEVGKTNVKILTDHKVDYKTCDYKSVLKEK